MKIDIQLIRNIDTSAAKRIIVHLVVQMCADMGIQVIGEGVEAEAELDTLRLLGIRYFQGIFLPRHASWRSVQ